MKKCITLLFLTICTIFSQIINREIPLHKDVSNPYIVECTLPVGSVVSPMIELSTTRINWSHIDSVRLASNMIISFPERGLRYTIPTGTTISGFKKSVLTMRLGQTMVIENGHKLNKGTVLELRPNGRIGYIKVKEFALVNSIPIHESDNKQITFRSSNYAPYLVSVYDTTIDGILYPGRYSYTFNSAGRVLSKNPIKRKPNSKSQKERDQKWLYLRLQQYYTSILTSPVTAEFKVVVTDTVQLIRGMPVAKGTAITYYPSGEIYGVSSLHPMAKGKGKFRKIPVYSEEEYQRERFPIPYEVTFYKSGKLRTIVTNRSFMLQSRRYNSFLLPGLIVGKNESIPSILYLGKDGTVLAAMSGEKMEKKSRDIPPNHFYTIDDKGNLSLWPELINPTHILGEK